MKILNKLKEVTLSILPVFIICLFIHLFIYRFSDSVIFSFFIGLIFIILGETLFFLGVDSSIMPMGEIVGNNSNKNAKIFVLIVFSFAFGLFATLAEPDVNVLAGQVYSMGVKITRTVFLAIIGAGVGAGVAFALFRVIAKIPFKLVLFIVIGVIIALSFAVPKSLVALAFDAGGATTGIITSPFLIAIASGFATKNNKSGTEDSFGVIGLGSLGPVLGLLFYFLIGGTGGNFAPIVDADSMKFGELLLQEIKVACFSILPIILIFVIYELIFVKLPKNKLGGIIIGGLVTLIGLFLFLLGLDYGLAKMGKGLGEFLITTPNYVIILFCAMLGFIIPFCEPAVKILGEQIEAITGGHIKSKVVLISIAIAMLFALTLNAIRILFNIDFIWIIVSGYAIALVLMLFSTPTFCGIGFDSGGVASGAMCSAFASPLMLALANGNEGFGVIALVALMPIIVLQILGIIYKIKLNAISKTAEKHALQLAYDMDRLSNMDKLKRQSNRIKQQKQKEEEDDEEN